MGFRYRVYRFLKNICLSLDRIVIERKLRKMGLAHASQIETHTTQVELQTLYRLAENSSPSPAVLEIGSYLGASTCYIAAAVADKNGVIFCVDTWMNQTMPGGSRDTFAEFQSNTHPLRHRITTLRKSSNCLEFKDISRSLDFVFIDGDHSYEQVKGDFQFASQYLAPAGLIAFHDCRYFPGVSKVIGEAVATGDWMLDGVVANLCWLRRAPDTWDGR